MQREFILDNSIFELGEAFDSEKFAGWVERLKPDFYIVPDVLESAGDTIKSYTQFTNDYPIKHGMRIGVVQGKTYQDLVECYKFMSSFADYIAISFDYQYYLYTGRGNTKLERYCDGRQRFIQQLISDNIWDWKKPVHLLGASLAREFGFYLDHNIYNIRSCDTSNPVVAGYEGVRYSGTLGLNTKSETKLFTIIDEEVSKDQLATINYNISQFRKIVKR